MGNLQRFADILQKMQDIIGRDKWFSNIDTDLNLYIDNLPIILQYLKQNDIIDIKNNVDVNNILSLCIKNKKENYANITLKQRLDFYILLGFLKIESSAKYSLSSLEWDFFYNDNVAVTFVEKSISLFRYFKREDIKDKSMYIPSIRIFTGFYVYLILNLLNNEEFDIVKSYLNGKTISKINKIKFKNISYKNTMDSTYSKFYTKYFKHLTIDDVILIGESIFHETDNVWDILAINNIQYDNSVDDKLEKIKMVMIEKQIRDVTNDKIKEILRKNFNKNIRCSSNNSSDIIINNIGDINSNFLESAHVISISEVSTKCIDLINIRDEELSQIIELTGSNNNGMLIPFNYHKFYDNQYIELSTTEPKFILTEKGINSIETLKILGYTENHCIKKNKYDEIMYTLSEYKKLLNNINN